MAAPGDAFVAAFDRLLREASDREDEGVTAKELCALTGLGRRAVLDRLVALGSRVEVSRRRIVDVAGRHTMTYSYRLRGE